MTQDTTLQSTDHSHICIRSTESAWLESKGSFCDEIYIAISSISRHDFLLVLVNFNARIRKVSYDLSPRIIARYSYHQNANGSGERLGSLCENSKLNLLFIVKHMKIVTCELGNVQMVYTA